MLTFHAAKNSPADHDVSQDLWHTGSSSTKHTAKLVGIGIPTSSERRGLSAGAKNFNPVVLDLSNRVTSGSLGDARKSADTQQFIDCTISTFEGSAPTLGCFARDTVTSSFFGCSTTNADMVATAHAIHGDSFIQFSWDMSAACISWLGPHHRRTRPASSPTSSTKPSKQRLTAAQEDQRFIDAALRVKRWTSQDGKAFHAALTDMTPDQRAKARHRLFTTTINSQALEVQTRGMPF